MFAVPGWAVSADGLKTETSTGADSSQNQSNSKKRKRQSAPASVTTSNVADLWEQVIEGRSEKKARSDQQADQSKPNKKGTAPDGTPRLTMKEKKKLKKQRENEAPNTEAGDLSNLDEAKQTDLAQDGKKDSKKKKRESQLQQSGKSDEKAGQVASSVNGKQASARPTPKLTPMQAAMREKLVSARFRHLNETLYTKPSEEAFQLFQETPEMFQEYHEGFRRQVDVWPENPIDGYIQDIKLRGSQRPPHRSKQGQNESHASSSIAPLPRTSGVCTIADLGCGDAKLAETLQSQKKKLNVKVLSYDLQSPSPLVIKADIANLPLEDGSVNVVVFCLALMGTNWTDFIEEACRVLHWKGELWVAEIKSRFGLVGKNKHAPVHHSVGYRRKTSGKKVKGKDEEPEEDHKTDLAVEVDGADDKRQETDVSAFVEALRRRGFVLQGEGKAAVDLSNKMFVKMRFLKGASPTVGKGAVMAKETSRTGTKKGVAKFVDAESQDAVDESKILKPCVYKIR
ncbi:methyltransferase-domain-containing protein [Xylariaceae sp. FL0016]|nr:methyltransferase-domain-containing protein [Xylariaceae sp. FL0016]